MSDLYNRISTQHDGPLEGLMRRLPGYAGYQQASDRRAADRLLRDHIVGALHDQKNALVQVEKDILNGGGLAYMSRLKDAASRMQVFIDRLNTAMPGYAGFYDALKIGPTELQALYNFDATMLDYVDKFKTAITALHTAATGKEGIDAAITALDTLTHDANTAYGQRENVITRLG